MNGGAPVTAGRVNELASELVEVHAQSSTNRLTKPAFIREAIDAFGKHQDLLASYQRRFAEHQELSSRVEQLRRDQKNRESEIARISEFMKAFSAVTPESGEISSIENELVRLNSVDELQQAVSYSQISEH